MIPSRRLAFNTAFTREHHEAFLARLDRVTGMQIGFRISETPLFLPATLEARCFEASKDLLRQLVTPAALARSAAAVPRNMRTDDAGAFPAFAQIDFAVTRDADGKTDVRLIELQGFPSLYAFQETLGRLCLEHHALQGLRHLAPGLTHEQYVNALRRIILGGHDPESVVLLDVDPIHQTTRPDFLLTERWLGIETVDISAIEKSDRTLFYRSRDGRLRPVQRIYNRAVPDEIARRRIPMRFSFADELDVEWVCHPSWFYRISKHALPALRHETVPVARFLDDFDTLPPNLDDYVLKPLYGFAGVGVVVAPTASQIGAIPRADRGNFVLQERITYVPVIDTPVGGVSAELRVMVLWENEPKPVMLLVRTGTGTMMGASWNASMAWTGATCGLVED